MVETAFNLSIFTFHSFKYLTITKVRPRFSLTHFIFCSVDATDLGSARVSLTHLKRSVLQCSSVDPNLGHIWVTFATHAHICMCFHFARPKMKIHFMQKIKPGIVHREGSNK